MSIASYTRALIITEVRRQLQERYDEVRVYRRILTAAELLKLAAA